MGTQSEADLDSQCNLPYNSKSVMIRLPVREHGIPQWLPVRLRPYSFRGYRFL